MDINKKDLRMYNLSGMQNFLHTKSEKVSIEDYELKVASQNTGFVRVKVGTVPFDGDIASLTLLDAVALFSQGKIQANDLKECFINNGGKEEDIQITVEDNKESVSFTYEGQEYNLVCVNEKNSDERELKTIKSERVKIPHFNLQLKNIFNGTSINSVPKAGSVEKPEIEGFATLLSTSSPTETIQYTEGEMYKLVYGGVPQNVIDTCFQRVTADDGSIIYKSIDGIDISKLTEIIDRPDDFKGTSLYEQVYGMYAKWSSDQIKLMGFNSDYVLGKYFTQNDDGTYSLKSAATQNGKIGLWVEDEFVSNIHELKDKLGILSLEEYIEENVGRNEYGTFYESNLDLDIGALLYRQGTLGFSYTTGAFLTDEAQVECDKFKADLAERLGKSVSELTTSDIVFEIIAQEAEMGESWTIDDLQIRVREYNIYNALMFDNAYSYQCLGDYTYSTQTDAYMQTPASVFNNVIYMLENHQSGGDYEFNNTLWNALLEAAGITDNDDIETRAEKMGSLMEKCDGCHTTVFGVRVDDPWANVFDYLMANGYLEQNSYSETELKSLYTDETIKANFYQVRDESGNIVIGNDGNPIYRLKRETGGELPICDQEGVNDSGMMTLAEANMYGYTIVSSAKELKEALNVNPNSTIVLSADIDMSGIDWIPVGTEEKPFIGKIFGNGFAIKNLTVNSSNQYAGLFGVFEGEAHSLILENCMVKDTRGTNEPGVGAIGVFAGKCSGSCSNIEVKNGSVYGRDNAGMLFGIVEPKGSGENVIEHCKASGSVYSEHTAGGIAGKFIGTNKDNGWIKLQDSSSSADVNGQIWAGGVVGQVDDAFRSWTENRISYPANEIVQYYNIEFLINCCSYNGSSINKDIKNPPGAVGAGGVYGQVSIPDFIKEAQNSDLYAKVNYYPEFPGASWGTPEGFEYTDFGASGTNVPGEFWNSREGKLYQEYPSKHIYNSYAAGTLVGSVCKLNDDGSIKEMQEIPFKDTVEAEKFGQCANERVGDLRLYWMKQKQSFGYEYIIQNSTETQPSSSYPDSVLNGTVGEQEQYITDPTYIEVIKQVILQNFVEYYDVNDSSSQLKLDQLDMENYVTRANYKELIDTIKKRTGLTNDELIRKTVEKLLAECTAVDFGDWLITLVTAMNGDIREKKDGKNTKDDAYVNTSIPPSITFELDGTTYMLSFVGQDTIKNNRIEASWKAPEYITPAELKQRLKEAGATNSQIESIIAEYYTECITREDKNGKEILMYYFNPTTANNNHYFYGCMFTGTDDIIRHLKGEEDEYTKFWNTLSSDPSFRTAVGKRVDSGLITHNSSGTSHDKREDIIPGVYSYKDFIKDEKGNYIESNDGSHYLYVEKVRLWDPINKVMIDTQIPVIDLFDNNNNLNYALLKELGVDAYIIALLNIYINRSTDFSELNNL